MPRNIQLTNQSSAAPGRAITGYKWTVNGSVVSTAPNPLLSGASDGSLDTILEVTQDDGQKDTHREVIPGIAVAGQLVDFSGAPPGHEYILGPLTVAGDGKMDGTSATTDREPWPYITHSLKYQTINATQPTCTGTIEYHLDRFPKFYPRLFEGTVSIENGSRKVYGIGTVFTRRIQPYPEQNELQKFWDLDKVVVKVGPNKADWVVVRVESVESDTEATLEFAWPHATVTDTLMSTDTNQDGSRSSTKGHGGTIATEFHVYSWRYYDIGKVAYLMAYRNVGYYDPMHPDFIRAQNIAGCWWQMPKSSDEGRASNMGNTLAPRSQAIEMLFLRALEKSHFGEADAETWWNFCIGYADYMFWSWGWRWKDNNQIYYIRDTGYVNMFTAQLGAILPDGLYTPNGGGSLTNMPLTNGKITGADARAWFKERIAGFNGAEDASGNLIDNLCRVQSPDGNWRDWYPEQGFTSGQPFQMGLLMDGMRFAYQLIKTDYPVNAANVLAALERGGRYFTRQYRRYDPIVDKNGVVTSEFWRDSAYNAPQMGEYRVHARGTAALTHGSVTVAGTATLFDKEFSSPGSEIGFLGQITGTIGTVAGSRTWTGDGTLFLSELAPGDMLMFYRGLTSSPIVVGNVVSDTEFETANDSWIGFEGTGVIADLILGRHLPGYVNGVYGSDILNGVGTTFTTDLAVGTKFFIYDKLRRWGHYKIAEILSDLQLRLDKPFNLPDNSGMPYSDLEGGGYRTATIADDLTMTLEQPFDHPRGLNVTGAKISRFWNATSDVPGGGTYYTSKYQIEESRVTQVEGVNILFWLAKETGNIDWLDWGENMLAATYGNGVGPGADSFCTRLYPTSSDTRSKPWNQCFRQMLPSLGWRYQILNP